MAAVLAHEVRNPLAAVRGAIQVLGRRYASEGRDAEVVKEILARLDGLNELMQDLLLFARPPEPRLAPIELRHVLTATANLLAEDPLLSAVHVEIAGEAPPIAIDRDLLKIAFHNVIVNAAQALRGTRQGGGDAFVDGPRPTGRRFADHGPGMTPRPAPAVSAVLHDQGAGDGTGAGDRPQPRRGTRRHGAGRWSGGRRNSRDDRVARRANGPRERRLNTVTTPARPMASRA